MAVFLGPATGPDGRLMLVAALSTRGVSPQRHRQRTRLVVDDYGDAVCHERRCCCCLRWMPLDFTLFSQRGTGDTALGMQSKCIECGRLGQQYMNADARRRRNAKARAGRLARFERDPNLRELEKAREAANRDRRRAADLEREKKLDHARQKRYRERLRKDPQRHARRLEQERMGRRLRIERKTGASVTEMRGMANVVRPTDISHKTSVPGVPLSRAMHAYVEKAGGSIEMLCDQIGFSARALSRWHVTGGGVSLDLADKALTRMGLCWWEVWTEDDPASYEAARRVFEADDLRRAA